jgi:hypothetical protein
VAQELQRQLLLDSIAVQRDMVSKLESLGAKIEANAEKTHANTLAIEEMRKSFSNGAVGRLCKKIDRTYWAVIVLLVPIITMLCKVLGVF